MNIGDTKYKIREKSIDAKKLQNTLRTSRQKRKGILPANKAVYKTAIFKYRFGLLN